jgi:hypothetical protein
MWKPLQQVVFRWFWSHWEQGIHANHLGLYHTDTLISFDSATSITEISARILYVQYHSEVSGTV